MKANELFPRDPRIGRRGREALPPPTTRALEAACPRCVAVRLYVIGQEKVWCGSCGWGGPLEQLALVYRSPGGARVLTRG